MGCADQAAENVGLLISLGVYIKSSIVPRFSQYSIHTEHFPILFPYIHLSYVLTMNLRLFTLALISGLWGMPLATPVPGGSGLQPESQTLDNSNVLVTLQDYLP